MKRNILIILNAVVYNRGSEALIRGISTICKKANPNAVITLVSSEEEFGPAVNIENIDKYCKKNSYPRKSIKRYIVSVLRKIKLNNIADNIQYAKIKKIARQQDLTIIVGADNYDISYHMQEKMYRFNSIIRKNTNGKVILYDCSIDQRDITNTLKLDFEKFDYVTVRESISKQNVERMIDKQKLYLYPDPAFTMMPQEVELPKIFENLDVIGVNVSNLITNARYGSEAEKILVAYKKVIDYMLNNTNNGILLIPHVMKDADLSTLRIVYEEYQNDKRVELITNEKYNAKQLKYIIAHCKMFIGARTHATIAAYSMGIPTLVLGYSVKSKGIAKDIFGTYENYVLPVSNLDTEDYLVNGFIWMNEHREQIKKKLADEMPGYIKEAENTERLIKECLRE